MLASILAAIGRFLGAIFSECIPAIGKEIRKNNTVQQKGKDDVTDTMLDDDIWNSANSNRVQRSVHADDKSAS